jgi:hypothetical protein
MPCAALLINKTHALFSPVCDWFFRHHALAVPSFQLSTGRPGPILCIRSLTGSVSVVPVSSPLISVNKLTAWARASRCICIVIFDSQQ